MAGHCLLQKQSPFSCAWSVVAWAVVISASGPEICNLAGGVCSGRPAAGGREGSAGSPLPASGGASAAPPPKTTATASWRLTLPCGYHLGRDGG
jgi:hypothetical protein